MLHKEELFYLCKVEKHVPLWNDVWFSDAIKRGETKKKSK